ncbi:SGNH/GDSL hydrolase family protein [Rhodococcoides fascians]|jgi:lysophospholipase L1-like esterase|uniref:SGNH/GDSL hydrolase family protein n=1 Tax=Rhodococcoides fascians TaxID=1828 RepID=UPI0009BBE59F|nr:SGNH/GDSL hydrolase family protein [Rhodococcus fascians]
MVSRRAGSGRATKLLIAAAAAIGLAVTILVGVALWHSASHDPDSYESSYIPPSPAEAEEPMFTLPPDPRVLFLGDSLTDGTAASNKEVLGFAPRLAKIEGWTDYAVDGVGLSGFLSPGISEEAHRNYRDRLQQIFFTNTYSPNVIIFQAGANDAPYSSSDIRKKVVETITVARKYWPNVQILLMGPITSSTNLSATNAAYRSAAHDSEIFYIDAMRTPMISPNERKELISDDGWHANDAGHQRIAEELHQRITEISMKNN